MPAAPRLHAYLEHVQGRSVLTMSRKDWESIDLSGEEPVQIDVKCTPMHAVASKASVVAASVSRRSVLTAEVAIVRYDAQDDPTPYNVDRYTVWPDLTRHPEIGEFVSAASTEWNANLSAYLTEHVFIVKQDHGPDHWLAEPPSSNTAFIRST